MDDIQMVDLRRQYERHREEINRAIQSVIDSTAFIKGPEVGLFEKELAEYMGVSHCIGCANGTDALQAAMMGLELKQGDEVITTPFTFIATIEVIQLLKLKPVLVDIDPDTFNIDPVQLEKAITGKTRAIVPVHLFGQAADMESLLEIAGKHQLFVIEDNAQATGTDFTFSNGTVRKTGTLGDIGCTSFFPSKNLGAFGDGGALFTNDDKKAVMLRSMINHGMTRRYHYEHVGMNSRLDTLQAAILRVKLKHLEEYNRARQEVASFYDSAFYDLPGVKIPVRNPSSTHIFHQYTLQLNPSDRDPLKASLSEKKIPAMIYYPVPLHMQNAYENLGYSKGDFPVTEAVCEKVLSLPIHTEMNREQLDYIANAVREFYT